MSGVRQGEAERGKPMKTKQIVFTRPYTAELLDVECPPPGAHEVSVRLTCSGISAGTEKANFIGSRNGINVSEDDAPVFPRTVGYSAAGVVTAVGGGVESVGVGDRVIVFWGKHCKDITISEHNVMKIPDEVKDEEAAIAFIATFPLAAVRKTKLEIGESAMVMGLGILGIFAVELLKAAGACPIIAADPVPARRALALTVGADEALDPLEEGFSEKVKEVTRGGVNVCIEVTGLGAGLIEALDCMRRLGRVALLGCTRSSRFEIDYYGKVHGPGISLIGAHTMARPKSESSPGLWTDRDDLDAILRLLVGKRLDFGPMISEIHSPAEANAVFNRLAADANFPIGVLFDWDRV